VHLKQGPRRCASLCLLCTLKCRAPSHANLQPGSYQHVTQSPGVPPPPPPPTNPQNKLFVKPVSLHHVWPRNAAAAPRQELSVFPLSSSYWLSLCACHVVVVVALLKEHQYPSASPSSSSSSSSSSFHFSLDSGCDRCQPSSCSGTLNTENTISTGTVSIMILISMNNHIRLRRETCFAVTVYDKNTL